MKGNRQLCSQIIKKVLKLRKRFSTYTLNKYFSLKVDMEGMKRIAEFDIENNDKLSWSCVGNDSKLNKWMQSIGFTNWTKTNCFALGYQLFINDCSIFKTIGLNIYKTSDPELSMIENQGKEQHVTNP